MNIGKYQLLIWWGFRLGREAVPPAFRFMYAWFFWLGPLEIRKLADR